MRVSAVVGLLLCLVVATGQNLTKGMHYSYLTTHGDIQEVYEDDARTAHALGATWFTSASRLWPQGKLNYYIETAATNVGNPATYFLTADDSRIAAGIAHWEAHTCLRFTRCTTQAACPTPYLYFISDVSSCSSPVGKNPSGINQINLQQHCGLGAVIHEIGHSVGLSHEQSRNDRDSFVYVDTTQIEMGEEGNFNKIGGSGRDIGPYDYSSIMHYGENGFAIGSLPTIVSPYPIGQRKGLSSGDIDTVHFMYNTCSDTYDAPICRSSRTSTTRHVIPHSAGYVTEFNAVFASGKTVTVTYTATTAPGGTMSYSKALGTNIGQIGNTQATFTPTAGEAGNDYTIGATFTGSDGTSVTCSIDVTVASSTAVCFGVASNDPNVCSGRGTCVANPLAPCTCNGAYGGLECFGFANCPQNYLLSFDEDAGSVNLANSADVDISFAAEGGASLRVGDPSDASAAGQGQLTLLDKSMANRVTWYMSRFDDAASSPSVYFYDTTSGNTCFTAGINNGVWHVNFNTISTSSNLKQFYFFDLRVNWAAQTVDLFVDGKQEATAVAFQGSCTTGINYAVFFKTGYYDEFHLWCTSYVVPSGTLVESVNQDTLRAGGATLTLTLVGDYDQWVDTTANKQAILDVMIADFPSATGWNALKATMLDTSKMTISGAVLTIGPLNPAPTFRIIGTETISLSFAGNMFTSGTTPSFSPAEAAFAVPGECTSGLNVPFDSASEVTSSVVEVTTATKKEGAGSLTWSMYGFIHSISAGGIKSTSCSYYGRVGSVNSQLKLTLVGDGKSIEFWLSIGTQFALRTDDTAMQFFGTVAINTWYHVELVFDWSASTLSVNIDSTATGIAAAIPVGFDSIVSVRLSTLASSTGCFIDSLLLPCERRDPAFDVNPSCPQPGTDAPVFHFYPGSDALATTDRVAVIPSTATDCTNAETQCAALNACSTSVGSLLMVGTATEWSSGTLSSLAGTATYKVCYRPTSYGQYILLSSSFATCGAASTSAPRTSAPDTSAPDTPAPDTPAPDTPAPDTPAPDTPAPDTPAPDTPAPDTPAPDTPAPDTLVPGTTAAPQTPAPDTAVPTTAPDTSAPDTPAPDTPAPDTPVPSTPSPDTSAPSTSAPDTPAPSTPAPSTSAPATPAPDTSAPSTLAPDTSAPATPAPDTSAPDTSAPATAAPDTLVPGTTAAPLTPAPVTAVPTTVPDTSTPDTLAPSTSAPDTLVPGTTAAPLTPAPDTAMPTTAPDTAAPDTQAPATSLPVTGAPSTPSPDTSTATAAPSTPQPNALGTAVPTRSPVIGVPDTLTPATPAPETSQRWKMYVILLVGVLVVGLIVVFILVVQLLGWASSIFGAGSAAAGTANWDDVVV
eukprot:TRINITY_DN1326_c0_g1_i2.p1 TRINITY_DN1326_c0_g1~~TRINITY_DN1326_c0_g1_i2.p1  ORF type:complete len:1375 (+),score=329.85 TRINITY_DN1326_c0_g1_i2:53-4126(+)